ncbi:hypothetical protein B296_00000982 [Ensete ventricosum]|uniref:Uncharacterized protein n=1 Tax=Ensete ventricosum TaxID=4639 RepID=A0A427B1T2_ENSVE|nr:hypothetical protein B296_00000982 [Ensete ventricosum]
MLRLTTLELSYSKRTAQRNQNSTVYRTWHKPQRSKANVWNRQSLALAVKPRPAECRSKPRWARFGVAMPKLLWKKKERRRKEIDKACGVPEEK